MATLLHFAEDPLDHIGRSDGAPMGLRKGVERQTRVLVTSQALPCRRIPAGVFLAKGGQGLLGPLPVRSAYVIGALSGYGIMAAPAAGELLADHIAGVELPTYARAFRLERCFDPDYQKLLENWSSSGQL